MCEHRMWSNEEIAKDIEYLRGKRDLALEKFNKKIKKGEDITVALEQLMRVQKQWILINDALIVYELKCCKND